MAVPSKGCHTEKLPYNKLQTSHSSRCRTIFLTWKSGKFAQSWSASASVRAKYGQFAQPANTVLDSHAIHNIIFSYIAYSVNYYVAHLIVFAAYVNAFICFRI